MSHESGHDALREQEIEVATSWANYEQERQEGRLTEKAYMGILMAKYKGKVSGKDLIELIRKHIKLRKSKLLF